MFKGLYDSIDTLKTVKVPSLKEILSLTVATIIIVFIMGAFLFAVNSLGTWLYRLFYDLFFSL